MKTYMISVVIGLTSAALALTFFFAGYLVRGVMEQPRTGAALTASTSQMSSSSAPQVASSATTSSAPQVRVPFVSTLKEGSRPSRGPQDAPVTIEEFSDFQCPFCKIFFDQTLPLVLSTYGDRVRLVYRDFPIPSLHPQAPKAAEAGQCAFEQGRFWEYHDRLFQNQGSLGLPSLKTHAAAVGLDVERFSECLDSGKYSDQVQADFDEGRAAGVTGTPTFMVNGRKLVGAQPFAAFQKLVDEELTAHPA